MKTITLADGTPVPHIAFGSGTALLRQECANSILTALKAGFTHIDTAQRYGNEDSVGTALKIFLSTQSEIKRSDLFVTTKFLTIEEGESVEDVLRESLKKLQLEYVDSYLVHAPIGWEKREGGVKGVWREMVEVKKKGLAKTIGVSNFNKKNLEEVLSTGLEPPSINQVTPIPIFHAYQDLTEYRFSQIEYHLLVAEKLEPLLAFSRAHGIVTSSYSGMIPILPSTTVSMAGVAPEELRARIGTVLTKLASARGPEVTHNQVLMKWILNKGVFVVTTSTKESRIKEYVATDDVKDLTDKEMEELKQAVGGAHFRSFVSVMSDRLHNGGMLRYPCTRHLRAGWMKSSRVRQIEY